MASHRPSRRRAPTLISTLTFSPSDLNSSRLPLTLLLRYLPIASCLSLRLCNRALFRLLEPFSATLFSSLRLVLTPHLFTPVFLSALESIGMHCTHLTIMLVHSSDTMIQLPAHDTPDRVHSLFPVPRDGRFSPSGSFSLYPREDLLALVNNALWRAAVDVVGWAAVFSFVPALRSIRMVVKGVPEGRGLQRSVVDEALLALRRVLEARRMAGLVVRFRFDGHGGGMWMLDPTMGWGGWAARKAWWVGVTRCEVVVRGETMRGWEAWEVGVVERAWAGVLREMAEALVDLKVGLVGRVDVGFQCPLLVEKTLAMPALAELCVTGFSVWWGEMSAFLERTKVVSLVVKDFWLEEEDHGWLELYHDWELENVAQNEWEEKRLRKKDKQPRWFGDGGLNIRNATYSEDKYDYLRENSDEGESVYDDGYSDEEFCDEGNGGKAYSRVYSYGSGYDQGDIYDDIRNSGPWDVE